MKKKNNNKKIIAVSLALVLLLGIGMIYFSNPQSFTYTSDGNSCSRTNLSEEFSNDYLFETWESSYPLLIDGDWNTMTVYTGNSNRYFVNYTKPDLNISGVMWEVKTTYDRKNYTLPQSCLDYSNDTVMLYINANEFSAHYNSMYCFDGSWNSLDFMVGGSVGIYEEKIYWILGSGDYYDTEIECEDTIIQEPTTSSSSSSSYISGYTISYGEDLPNNLVKPNFFVSAWNWFMNLFRY